MKKAFFVFIYFIVFFSFYLISSCAPSECVRNSDCNPDQTCFENRCSLNCDLTNGWCPNGLFCVDGVCLDSPCYKGNCQDSGDLDSDVFDNDILVETEVNNDVADVTDVVVDVEFDSDFNDSDVIDMRPDSLICPDSVILPDLDIALPNDSDSNSDNDAVDNDVIYVNPDKIVFPDGNSVPDIVAFDNDAVDEDFISDKDEDLVDVDCGGGILNDDDGVLDFSGNYNYVGVVSKSGANVQSVYKTGDSLLYYLDVIKKTNGNYDINAEKDSKSYFSVLDVDLNSQFNDGDNLYAISYKISYNESPNCIVNISVSQQGSGSEFPKTCGSYTVFEGSEQYCYQFTGPDCSVKGCSSSSCNEKCIVEFNFKMEEKH
jgi:hypothetical protein